MLVKYDRDVNKLGPWETNLPNKIFGYYQIKLLERKICVKFGSLPKVRKLSQDLVTPRKFVRTKSGVCSAEMSNILWCLPLPTRMGWLVANIQVTSLGRNLWFYVRLNEWTATIETVNNKASEEKPHTEHDNIVSFVDGENVKTAERRNNTELTMKLGSWLGGTVGNDIKDFLARPQIAYTYYGGGPVVGTMTSVDVPSSTLNLAGGVFRSKVSGFLGFRATAVMTMTFNVTKFTQGRLIIAWLPNASMRETGRFTLNRTTITQLPHVQVDVACSSRATLRVPYYSVAPYANIKQLLSAAPDLATDFGTFYIYCYGAVAVGSQAGTSEVIGIKAYVHYEDVDLVVPTLSAQAGGSRKVKVKSGINPSDVEKDKPISTGLMLVSKAAESFSKVPLLTPVFSPVSWVSAMASNVVSALGFSKPPVDTPTSRVARQELAYMNNFDGCEALIPMGNSGINHVGLSNDKLGCDYDEMSLRYFSQIPAFVASVSWSSNSPSGTILKTGRIMSSDYGYTTSSFATLPVSLHCPVSYLNQSFYYFHGSIILDIKVVKTTFHVGRLTLLYYPGIDNSAPIPDDPYILKEVIDLTQGSEFSVTLPHANLSYWLALSKDFQIPGTRLFDDFGTFSIIVDAPLSAPETCSSSVDLLIEMRGGDDCEFAHPVPTKGQVLSTGADPSTTGVRFGIQAQASGVEPCANIPERGSFGGLMAMENTDDVTYSSLVVGESFKSIKQLLSRATRFGQLNSGTNLGFSFRVADIVPRTVSVNPVAASDTVTRYAACFGYATGGYKYYATFENVGTGDAPIISTGPYYWDLTGTFEAYPSLVSVNNNYLGWTSQYASSFTSTNVLSFVVPAYNQLPMRIITRTPMKAASANNVVSVQTQGSFSGYINTWRALGEDGRYSFFLGVPPITYAV